MQRYRTLGFSMVEVMLALLLGTFLVLTAASVFVSSRRTMDSSNALSSVQEGSRIAYEMLGRDLREAGGNPCSASAEVGNILNSRGSGWWSKFSNGIAGYGGSDPTPGTEFGTAPGQRTPGTDAVDVFTALGGGSAEARVIAKMLQPSANIQVSSSASFANNDIVMVCDPTVAYIFQVTQVQGPGTSLQHNSGNGSPGNCTKDFTSEFVACNNSGVGYLFEKNAMVAKLSSARWYVGANNRGGSSLYRADMNNTGSGATPTTVSPVEVAADVTDLQMDYLVTGASAFVPAASVTDWGQVRAVRARLILSASTGQAASSQPIERDSNQIFALRNRTL